MMQLRLPPAPWKVLFNDKNLTDGISELYAAYRPKAQMGVALVQMPLRQCLFHTHQVTHRHLVAACAIPGRFPPVRIGGALYCDACVIDSLNLWAAHDMGATTIVANVREAEGFFDLILESVGGASLSGAISKVAPGGTIVMFGNSSREETPISFPNFAGHAFARLIAFFVYLSGTLASMGEDLAKLVSMVAAGKLKPEIGLEDSWHNVYKAAAALRDRKINGKAVFHINLDQ